MNLADVLKATGGGSIAAIEVVRDEKTKAAVATRVSVSGATIEFKVHFDGEHVSPTGVASTLAAALGEAGIRATCSDPFLKHIVDKLDDGLSPELQAALG